MKPAHAKTINTITVPKQLPSGVNEKALVTKAEEETAAITAVMGL